MNIYIPLINQWYLEKVDAMEDMPIKWNPLRVSEAMDMVEEFVSEAIELLEQAKMVTNEARNIPNLPQYLDLRLVRLIIDFERMDYIRNSIKAVRNDLPARAAGKNKRVIAGN